MKAFMLAGTSSNVGKTTVTMGIMGALKKRKLAVKPFKTGPDYIDPMFHHFVTGEESINLDTWMLDEETIESLFADRLEKDQVAIIEGVMGLYDGQSLETDIGSSACLAKTLQVPVILIIDGRGMAKSAAALVKGFVNFDPQLVIKGVIINRISTESHYLLLKEMIEAHNQVTCLGYFPNAPEIALDSRHLGLVPVEELADFRQKIDQAADLAEKYINLDKLLELSQIEDLQPVKRDPFAGNNDFSGLRIGIAKDRAFNFYYADNLKALKKLGIILVPFSPLKDKNLPQDLDGLYLGGGFPEVFGQELSANADLLAAIKRQLEEGLPCYAECGGLMYLMKEIVLKSGQAHQMVGFLNGRAKMTNRLQRFGYVNICAYVGGKSVEIKGHEFHHSLVELEEKIPSAYVISRKGKIWTCGYRQKNVLAAYPHVHFYSNPDFLKILLTRLKAR